MKNLILAAAIFVTTITFSQKSLFSNISTKDQYQRFFSVQDKDGDGLYEIKDRDLIVKFNIKSLTTGEGYRVEAIIDTGNSKGKLLKKMDALEGYSTCTGYPYESNIRHRPTKSGFVAIGDYVFDLYKMSDDGISYGGIATVFIKVDDKNTAGSKKKKKSFREKMRALKNAASKNPSYGAAHKALQNQNLDKLITDYLVAMKAKQNARTSAEKQADNNLKVAKGKGAADLKKYNDSVKATPKYKDLQRRIKQNEKNYQAAQKANVVTLRNTSRSSIYVGKSGSVNRGTEIPAGRTGKWDCKYDAYIQRHTIEGGSNAYRSTKTKVYSADSGCGNTININ